MPCGQICRLRRVALGLQGRRGGSQGAASRKEESRLGNLTTGFWCFFLPSCCADSSSPQISAILAAHSTLENNSLGKSPRFSVKLPEETCRQVSKSWLAKFPSQGWPNPFVYTYIHMCIYIYIYSMCVCVYMCKYTNIYIYIYIYDQIHSFSRPARARSAG